MKTTIQETTIPNTYTSEVQNHGMLWNPELTQKVYNIVFSALGHYLRLKRNSETKQKIALQVDDFKGDFILAGVVEYQDENNEAGDGESLSGNWLLSLTFDPADLEGAQVFHTSDTEYMRMFAERAINLYCFALQDPHLINPMVVTCGVLLKNWLDLAAKEGEVVELDGEYFTARVEVEGNKKIFAIEPSADMTQLIKDDAGNQI